MASTLPLDPDVDCLVVEKMKNEVIYRVLSQPNTISTNKTQWEKGLLLWGANMKSGDQKKGW